MGNIYYHIVISLLICFYAYNAAAQKDVYIYPKTSDYTENKPIKTKLIIEQRPRGVIALNGGSDFKIYHLMDEELSKKLKKEYFLVMENGNLFVNCIYIGNKWYGPSFYRNENYIFFIGGPSTLLNYNERTGGGGIIFGGLAGADAATTRYNYVIDLHKKSIHFVEPEYMKKVFGETELYERYRKEKNPYLTETVKKYLEEFYK